MLHWLITAVLALLVFTLADGQVDTQLLAATNTLRIDILTNIVEELAVDPYYYEPEDNYGSPKPEPYNPAPLSPTPEVPGLLETTEDGSMASC